MSNPEPPPAATPSPGFHGLGVHLGNLSRLSHARTRSITAENRSGAPGMGGRATEGMGLPANNGLGPGWKVSPCDPVGAGETLCLADIEGPGAIQHIWMTLTGPWRLAILRIYWDDQDQASVEVPAGDFFGLPWGRFAQINALPIQVNPGSGFNSYFEMPFQRRCRITLENLSDEGITAFYQIDYALTEVEPDRAYFHAQFRRSNPVPQGELHTILDGIEGQGHYVGTVMGWGVHHRGWWGEGEVQFFLDGDAEFPTICGTGTEDYFGGAYNFEHDGAYREFSTPYLGMPQVIRPDGLYDSQQRFSLYRFHVQDPIRFQDRLAAKVQCLGWSEERKGYLQRSDEISSVAYWYQSLPTAPFPALPGRDGLDIT